MCRILNLARAALDNFKLGFDVIVIIIALALRCIEASRCNREPDGRFGQKVHGDNGFRIKVSGSPDKYVPGEVYTGQNDKKFRDATWKLF
ncbi:hypothetical protein QYM36_016971 [Artemia franciscana]|uniref:Uncharacterized protein n=1 Tax=Artemia franciscana TaxID=6661 RepID=A0AA88KSI8_ARTSF|nr:hypothetical protein QYM36_016971 [Artemia franciscana]